MIKIVEEIYHQAIQKGLEHFHYYFNAEKAADIAFAYVTKESQYYIEESKVLDYENPENIEELTYSFEISAKKAAMAVEEICISKLREMKSGSLSMEERRRKSLMGLDYDEKSKYERDFDDEQAASRKIRINREHKDLWGDLLKTKIEDGPTGKPKEASGSKEKEKPKVLSESEMFWQQLGNKKEDE